MEKKQDWEYEDIECKNPFEDGIYLDVPEWRKHENVALMLMQYEICNIYEQEKKKLEDAKKEGKLHPIEDIPKLVLWCLSDTGWLHEIARWACDKNFDKFKKEWDELVKEKDELIARRKLHASMHSDLFPEHGSVYKDIATAYEEAVEGVCRAYCKYRYKYDKLSEPEEIQRIFQYDDGILCKFHERLESYQNGMACELIKEIGVLDYCAKVNLEKNTGILIEYINSKISLKHKMTERNFRKYKNYGVTDKDYREQIKKIYNINS